MAMKARPSNIKPVKNPFLKPDVPLLSQELQDASRQNLQDAIAKQNPPPPVRRRRPRGGDELRIGAVRG